MLLQNTCSILSAVLPLLLLPAPAHADFHSALNALQQGNGEIMLAEIKNAISRHNYEGVSLFIHSIAARYRNRAFYVYPQATKRNFYQDKTTDQHLLNEGQATELISLLTQVEPNADVESQFALHLLRLKINGAKGIADYPDQGLEKFALLGSEKAILIRASKSAIRLSSSLTEEQLHNEFNWIIKSAEKGQSLNIGRLAVIYMRWTPSSQYPNPDERLMDVTPMDTTQGIYWLKKAATMPETEGAYGCRLADEYLYGEHQDIKQAYLWYLEAYARDYSDCAIYGLRNMAEARQLDEFDTALDEQLKVSQEPPYKYMNNLRVSHEPPRDLIDTSKETIASRPVYSSIDNTYRLDIYRDGQVQFQGWGNSYIQGQTKWRIPQAEFKSFMSELSKVGLDRIRQYSNENILCDTGETWRRGYVSVTTNDQTHVISYTTIRRSLHTPTLAKLFKIQETYVPTQHLRCGTPRMDDTYKDCVAADQMNFKMADESQATQ